MEQLSEKKIGSPEEQKSGFRKRIFQKLKNLIQ